MRSAVRNVADESSFLRIGRISSSTGSTAVCPTLSQIPPFRYSMDRSLLYYELDNLDEVGRGCWRIFSIVEVDFASGGGDGGAQSGLPASEGFA